MKAILDGDYIIAAERPIYYTAGFWLSVMGLLVAFFGAVWLWL